MYGKNPYDLRRSWTVVTQQRQDEECSREDILEREIKQLKEQLTSIQERLLGSDSDQGLQRKDQGTSKRLETGSTFLGRLRSSIIQREEEQDSESSEPPPYSSSSSVQNERLGATKTVFIKNVELTLNNQPLDMLDTEEGKHKQGYNVSMLYRNRVVSSRFLKYKEH